MKEIYLNDSPDYQKLKSLQESYDYLDIESVLLFFEIQKGYKKMKQQHDSLMFEHDLTEAKFSVMMLLSYEEDRTLSPSELAQKIGSKKSTITGIIKGMEELNYIRRVHKSEDKRTNYVQLTEQGLNKLKEFLPFNYHLVNQYFEVFSQEELKTYFKLANKLRKHLEGKDMNE
ncbi:MarR family winged helix-turn-helix transcriptional regulator [Facklamia lactis]|uniref:MarR family winged helix-turn-helix transcriptional regulator n=1 Tax=Facklamia lactis TaxID=2749967 RepID=UPI0018CC9D81|nr:MarR family transcriptional regulator [Facklamia lactis]MBG9979431.1 MarR family transcriptional regulator [Facklamia lactis]